MITTYYLCTIFYTVICPLYAILTSSHYLLCTTIWPSLCSIPLTSSVFPALLMSHFYPLLPCAILVQYSTCAIID
ncbi:hypothetical protein XENTR_v10011792 [Xenopus tropicalis]|nr:hypothetical protein XENTR_v10011792 [Xenopus tropicalis]